MPRPVVILYNSFIGFATVLFHHLVHAVDAGGLADDETGGFERAAGKDRPALRMVGQGDDLVVQEETHLMVAADGAAPDSVNADFTAFPPGIVAFPAVAERGLLVAERIQKGLGCTARGVVLIAVMFFDDFNVIIFLFQRILQQ